MPSPVLNISQGPSGPIITTECTLRAVDRRFFIHTAILHLVHENDKNDPNRNDKDRFDWLAVYSSRRVASDSTSGSVPYTGLSVNAPTGFTVDPVAEQLCAMSFARFGATMDALKLYPALMSQWQNLQLSLPLGPMSPVPPQEQHKQVEQAYTTLLSTEPGKKLQALVANSFQWKAGRYEATLTLRSSDPDREFVRKFTMTLSDDDVRALGDVRSMVKAICPIGQIAHIPPVAVVPCEVR